MVRRRTKADLLAENIRLRGELDTLKKQFRTHSLSRARGVLQGLEYARAALRAGVLDEAESSIHKAIVETNRDIEELRNDNRQD